MDRFETKDLDGYHLKSLVRKRFIDNIFIIQTHVEESLNKFIDCHNSLHETIKVTHEMSYSEIRFLDTTVKLVTIGNSSQPSIIKAERYPVPSL